MGKIIRQWLGFNDTAVQVFLDYAIAGKGQPFNNSSSAEYDRKYLLRGNGIMRNAGFFDPLKSPKAQLSRCQTPAQAL